MRLPIVSTDHVLGPEALSRACVRGLEMLGGSADGFFQREFYQRVFCEPVRGVPLFDCVFGFSVEVTPAGLAGVLKADAAGLPARVVPSALWKQQDVEAGLEELGYRGRRLSAWSLIKAGLDLDAEPDDDFQVLPARSVYADVTSLVKSRFAEQGDAAAQKQARAAILSLDEPRLETYIFRKAGKPVGMFSLLTVNTTGLIVDFYADPNAGSDLPGVILWHALDLCARSQHVSVSAVLDCGISEGSIWSRAGFVDVPGLMVWDRLMSD